VTVPLEWAGRRKAAAWYIRRGRELLRNRDRFDNEISRRDNNAVFSMGFKLISIGRSIAMGYELEVWTEPIYRAHLKATNPRRAGR
jgi:hypothetical protein